MKQYLKAMARWLPAAAAAAVVLVSAVLYREPLAEWLGPMWELVPKEFREQLAVEQQQEPVDDQDTIGPFEVGVQTDPAPPRPGDTGVTVTVRDTGGIPVEGAAVQIDADDTASLAETAPGVYQGDVTLDEQDTWELTGNVHTVDMRHAHFSLELAADSPRIAMRELAAPEAQTGDGVAHWTCSMHPSVKADSAGTCPICAMDLVPVTHEEIESGQILVDSERRQLIGVKTGQVRRENLVKTIRTVANVVPAEPRVHDVTLKVDAWIGDVHADFTGTFVEAGEPMFTFYSPELWSAQEEYLEGLRQAETSPERGKRLREAAKTRLRLWGVAERDIDALRARGEPLEYMPYRSDFTGTVLKKNIVEGSAAEAGALLYTIADLSEVWIDAEVYESELPLVQTGQTADIELSYVPGYTFEGTISYIYPYLNARSRTGRIRIAVPNPDGVLKPDMYTSATINVRLGERLVIPESAVIYAGKSRVAFLDLGEGRLEPRVIETGVRTDNVIEVLSGLEAGDEVVTSTNFLIAAESKLKAGIDKW